MRNLQGIKVKVSSLHSQIVVFTFSLFELKQNLFRSANVQDAQQQRLCTQEASILQMKQELLRASMTKDDLVNKNVRQLSTRDKNNMFL